MADKRRTLAEAAEEQEISRRVMAWINSYPDLPVSIINFEQLRPDLPSMALSVIQATAIVRRFITGGHVGEYQFKLIYRLKPGSSNDARLKADELLDAIGDWAGSHYPDLGEIRVRKVEPTTRSSTFAIYENGDEDHKILFRMEYEVI